MDPNANLEEQRQIVGRILAMTVEEAGETAIGDLHADAVRLAELVEALDTWLTSGGFLPLAWGHGHGR